MKAALRLTARSSTAFAADPDPSTSPEDVPAGALFRVPESAANDGVPNALLLWLLEAPVGETLSVEVWALDEDTARVPGALAQLPTPSEANGWAKLLETTVVTAPVLQVASPKPLPGVLYVRQTASTLVADAVLKVGYGVV